MRPIKMVPSYNTRSLIYSYNKIESRLLNMNVIENNIAQKILNFGIKYTIQGRYNTTYMNFPNFPSKTFF